MGLNLVRMVKNVTSQVNPILPVDVRVSVGNSPNPDSKRTPLYATPCSFMGSISGTTLSVQAMGSGVVQVGQAIFDEAGNVAVGTSVVGLGTGTGGPGTYEVSVSQDVAFELMQSKLSLMGQIQPVTWRDLQQLDGLNLNGTRKVIYLTGQVHGIVRQTNKGGDLITMPDGTVYLVALVLEGWATAGWCKAAITRQDGS